MSRKLKALLLATAIAAGPAAAPASAGNIIDDIRQLLEDAGVDADGGTGLGNCHYAAFRDPTDPQGQTWIELTASVFLGTADVTRWEVTCWLQTQEDYEFGEISNTRHTCSGVQIPAGACANPVIYQVPTSEDVYQCEHVEWTDGVSTPDPLALVDHLLRDVFSTGGITTMGGVAQITATVTMAVTNLIATLENGPAPATHTRTTDADPATPGIQCALSQA